MRFPCKARLMVIWAIVLLGANALAPTPGLCVAGTSANSEYQVKAAFLFNFARFVEWPARKFPQQDSPLIVGLVGADPFQGMLEEAIQDRRVNERRLVVRHITSNAELRKCHLLFVSRSERDRLGPILSEVRGENVLTVGETDKFVTRGGIINFVMIDNNVRFQINERAAKHAGLKISSKLLQLAVTDQ